MSIAQFFRMLWAKRLLVGAVTAATLFLAIFVSWILPPRYEATSRVMLDIVKPDPVTGDVIASQWARAYVKTQIELIRDYRVAGKAADAAGWLDSPELAKEYRESGADEDMDFRRWLAQRIIDHTEADLVAGSNILEITYSSTSPEPAAKLADLVRDAYVEQTLAFRREAARRNADWFDEQTETLRADLAAAQKEKTDFERANGVILTDDLVDTDTARLRALASSPPPMQTQSMAGGGVAPSSGQLSQIDAAIAAASQTLGPNHPDLQQLRQQRSALASAVARENAAQPRMVTSGPSLGSLYSAQQAKVLENAGAAGEARRLATDVLVLRDQYQKTAARAAELGQEANSNESGLTLLGDAVAPQMRTFPRYPLIAALAIAGGLALGIFLALCAELLWRRVRGAEELEILDAPVFGVMSQEVQASPKGSIQDLFTRTKGVLSS
ncbi:Wzz/FepE/Etk N-terminal domain-containing protein [Erythrobacter sp. SD-21]|uniref:GumC family protein n=1 Tax=Erythrobacter sp. SD-21 TaxID=161528 RepID=UPI000153F3A3|nr:Wzz/FepE/Etk N-terminal domain-containing protein [Erythrobacter sp. SD-21]EDL49324.1 chain length determinant protein [Erythrobacter sp. SD-21]